MLPRVTQCILHSTWVEACVCVCVCGEGGGRGGEPVLACELGDNATLKSILLANLPPNFSYSTPPSRIHTVSGGTGH